MAKEFSLEEALGRGTKTPTEFSLEEALGTPAPAPQERTIGESIKDVGAGLVSGLGSIVQVPGQLYGLATGDFSDRGLLGVGQDISEYGEEMKSAGLKAREAERARAVEAASQEGQFAAFKAALGQTITDPALLTTFLAEQAPQVIPMILAGGGAGYIASRKVMSEAAAKGAAMEAAKKLASQRAVQAGTTAAIQTGAVMQGSDVGAGAYDDIVAGLIDRGATPEEAAEEAINKARAAGLTGYALSVLANRYLPGGKALEEILAGKRLTGSVLGSAAVTGLKEIPSENIEEVGGRIAQNIAARSAGLDRDIMSGTGEAAAMATLGAAGIGGAAGALSRKQEAGAEPETPEAVAAFERDREQFVNEFGEAEAVQPGATELDVETLEPAAAAPVEPPVELPGGFTVARREVARQEVPEAFGIFQEGSGKPLVTVGTPQEVEQKLQSLTQIRKEEEKRLNEEFDKITSGLLAEERKIEVMEATGQAGTDQYVQATALLEQKKLQENEKLVDIRDRIQSYSTPLTFAPIGRRTEVQNEFVVNRGEEPVGVFPSFEAAQSTVEQLAPEAFKQAEQARVQKRIQDIDSVLKPAFAKFNLGDVGLNIVEAIKTDTGGLADGAYARNLIQIAVDADKPLQTMRHETVHALKELGFFTPQQWKVLTERANKDWLVQLKKIPYEEGMSRYDAYLDMFTKDGQRKGLQGPALEQYANEALIEESIADAFGAYSRGATPPPGMIAALFKKLQNFFMNFGQALRGAGFESADDIFQRIERGELKSRKPKAEKAADVKKLSLAGAGVPMSTRNLMEQQTPIAQQDLGLNTEAGSRGTNNVRDIAKALNRQTLDQLGAMNRNKLTQDESTRIAEAIADEVAYQLQTSSMTGTGEGWYSNNYPNAVKRLGKRFPELITSKYARSVFSALVAVTSNGERVTKNIDNAIKLYTSLRKGKRLVVMGNRRATALENNLQVIQDLMAEHGENFEEVLLKEITVSEMNARLRKMGKKADNSYLANTVVPAAAVYFGPKLGAFYANLSGSEGYLTMDLWWTRSINRMRGLLIPKATNASISKFRDMMESPNATRDEVVAATIPLRNKYEEYGWNSELEHLTGAKEPSTKAAKPAWFEKAEKAAGEAYEQLLFEHNLEKMANTIYKNEFEMLAEAPFTSTDRKFMYDAARKAQTLLRNDGIDLSLADIQAALWYYEKRLYAKLSGRKADDIGYEEAIIAQANQGSGRAGPSVVFNKRTDRGDESRGEVSGTEAVRGQPSGGKERLKDGTNETTRPEQPAVRPGPRSDEKRKGGEKYSLREDVRSYRERNEAFPETHTRRSLEDGGRLRVLGARPIAQYIPVEQFKAIVNEYGFQSPVFYEISGEDADVYAKAIQKAKDANPFGAAVYVYPVEQYADMRLFITEDGKSGVALKDDDIVSVFSGKPHKGSVNSSIQLAVQEGGRRLDAFDTVLTDLYHANGFQVVGRMRWNEDYKPDNWDKKTFYAYNNGEPDVVYMAYNPDDNRDVNENFGKYFDDPDELAQAQKDAVNKYVKEGTGYGTARQAETSRRIKAKAGELPKQGRVRGSLRILDDKTRAKYPNLEKPVAGLPATIKVDGVDVTFGPYLPAREAAVFYAEEAGLPYRQQASYHKLDPSFSKMLANSYARMIDEPNAPQVKAAYKAWADETIAQYKAMLKTGIKVEFFPDAIDTYGNPRNSILDVLNNNHLYVFPADGGFGQNAITDDQIKNNPALALTDIVISGRRARVVEVFRATHDFFGHIKEGFGFRAEGEENAFQSHVRMYSPLAARAMTAGTRGQNSEVNFGRNAEFNKTASGKNTKYADQKIGLMPEWASTKEIEPDATEESTSEIIGKGVVLGTLQSEAKSFKGIHYGNAKVNILNGNKYGTGIRGAESKRLDDAFDERIKKRVYFYIKKDDGSTPVPESGVGQYVYTQKFDNILPPGPEMSRLFREANGDANNFETNIIDAGYDGYAVPSMGMMVVLNHNTPVEYRGTRAELSESDQKLSLKNVRFPSVKAVKEAVAKTSVPTTPEFKRFIAGNQWVDEDGKAAVFYHATAREFFEFIPAGQSQAIFLATTPEEAETFGSAAEDKLRREIYRAINKDEKLDFFQGVVNAQVEKGTITKKQGEDFIRQAKRKIPEYGDFGDIEQEVYDALLDLSPTRMSIMPLYARAETPFDFENADHVEQVMQWVTNNTEYPQEFPEKWLAGLKGRIKQGLWQAIEDKRVQMALRRLGFDSFTVRENRNSPKNYAVYKPEQVKSVTGNLGEYGLETKDVRFSLRSVRYSPTRFEDLYNKSMYTNNDNTTKGYLGFVQPMDFVRATSNEDTLKRLRDEQEPLNFEKMRALGPIGLQMSKGDGENWKIIGHEGRHRMLALADAGYRDIPVYIEFGSAVEDAKSIPTKSVRSQDRDSIDSSLVIAGLEPLSYANRTKAQNVFTREQPVKYSLPPIPQGATDRISETTTVREEKNFAKRIVEAISPQARSYFRAASLNRYNQASAYDKLRANEQGGAVLLADQSAESAALMSDVAAGVAASAMGTGNRTGGIPVLRNGITTIDSSVKGMVAALAPLAVYGDPKIYRRYQYWAMVKRGVRLNVQGKQVGITTADVAYAKMLEKMHPEFVSVQKDLIAFNNGLVKYMIDTGVLSKERGAEYVKYADYVPFYRQMDGEKTLGPSLFQSLSGVRPPKQLKGGDAPLADFLETMVRNTAAAIQAGAKNYAAQRMINVVTDIKNLPPGMGATRLAKSSTSPHVINVLENGELVSYETPDSLLLYAMKSLNQSELPFMSIISGPADMLRNLVTRDPGFMMANLLRDSLSAYVTSGKDMTPVVDTVINVGKALGNMSPTTRKLLDAGVISGYDTGNIEESGRDLEEDLARKAGKRRDSILFRPFTSVWEALEKGTTASDAATRAVIYDRVLAETGNEAEAIFRSLEVMNFHRKGGSALVRVLTAAVPFFNARLQGLDLFYRASTGNMNTQDAAAVKTKFWARGATMMALSGLYWFLVSDDEEYKKQEQETKDNNWLFPGLGFRIPTPFEVGFLFKTVPERIAEFAFGDDTGKDFAEAMQRGLVSTFAFNPMPQTFKPIWEAYTDKSSFTGRSIVGEGLKDVVPEYQIGPSTSKTAIAVGQTLGLSPMKVDHVIKGYTGTMGTYLIDTIDAVSNQFSDVPSASKRFEQMPIIKRFTVDPEARGSVTQYYQLKDSVDTVVRTMNLLEKTGESEAYVEYVTKNRGTLAFKDYIRDTEKTMTELRSARRAIRASAMSGDEKRDALLEISRAESQITSQIQRIKQAISSIQ